MNLIKNSLFNMINYIKYILAVCYQYIIKTCSIFFCFRMTHIVKDPIFSNILHKHLYYLIPPEDIKMRSIVYSFITKAIQKVLCCNPNCNNKIIDTYYLGYDGRYCSDECRNIVIHILDKYWQNMI